MCVRRHTLVVLCADSDPVPYAKYLHPYTIQYVLSLALHAADLLPQAAILWGGRLGGRAGVPASNCVQKATVGDFPQVACKTENAPIVAFCPVLQL